MNDPPLASNLQAENARLIALPRGCLDAARSLLRDNGIACDLKYERFAGAHLDVAFGVYPDVSLKSARDRRDAVRAAYNFAEHLPERKRMMQSWADYLDTLRIGATVMPLTRTA